MEQKLLFDDGGRRRDDDVITSEAEIRELARDYLSLPDAEPPLLRAKREQAARANGAHLRGMVAKWADYEIVKGHVSIHDPGSAEWHDVTWKQAPGWAKWEAKKRAALYRSGDRRAYELNTRQMEEIWHQEHAGLDEGIVEDHPPEEEAI